MVRRTLYPDEGPPRWNGVTMWRGTTLAEPFLSGRTMNQCRLQPAASGGLSHLGERLGDGAHPMHLVGRNGASQTVFELSDSARPLHPGHNHESDCARKAGL